MATAADSLGDVAATSATILSMLIFGLLEVNVDGIVGLAVSVVVMIAGVNIAKDTLAPLIGEAIDPEVYREITRFVESYPGIVGTHDLIVHNYGPGRSMASIHAEVPQRGERGNFPRDHRPGGAGRPEEDALISGDPHGPHRDPERAGGEFQEDL